MSVIIWNHIQEVFNFISKNWVCISGFYQLMPSVKSFEREVRDASNVPKTNYNDLFISYWKETESK